MGIPQYFSWLVRKYPFIRTFDKPSNIDNLAFDFNCLIYHVYNGLVKSELLKGKNKDQVETLLIKDTVKYTNYIIKEVVKPRKSVFIAIDGVVPMAKMHQQRIRRFRSIKLKEMEDNVKKQYGVNAKQYWDTNNITPGTEFMNKLASSLLSDIDFDGDYILSDHLECGEGEHKIMANLKSGPTCVYGLDADLIILCMSKNRDDMVLLRENMPESDLITVSIKLIRDCFLSEMPRITSPDGLITDYVFLSFFLGNDFLHSIPSMKIGENGVIRLLDIYSGILKKRKRNLVQKGHIDKDFLLELVGQLAKNEEKDLKELQERKRTPRIPDFETELEEALFMHNRVPLNERFKEEYSVMDYTKRNWKRKYYNEFFGTDSEKYISEVCQNYIEGLRFTLDYYYKETPSWDWYYHWPVSPMVSDIYEALKKSDPNRVRFAMSEPVKPLQQLLLVFPPQNANLLPPKYARLMTDSRSPIIEYYPLDFKLDVRERFMLYMAEPLIPAIDKERVLDAFDNVK